MWTVLSNTGEKEREERRGERARTTAVLCHVMSTYVLYLVHTQHTAAAAAGWMGARRSTYDIMYADLSNIREKLGGRNDCDVKRSGTAAPVRC